MARLVDGMAPPPAAGLADHGADAARPGSRALAAALVVLLVSGLVAHRSAHLGDTRGDTATVHPAAHVQRPTAGRPSAGP